MIDIYIINSLLIIKILFGEILLESKFRLTQHGHNPNKTLGLKLINLGKLRKPNLCGLTIPKIILIHPFIPALPNLRPHRTPQPINPNHLKLLHFEEVLLGVVGVQYYLEDV
jgi:hypothetical protein